MSIYQPWLSSIHDLVMMAIQDLFLFCFNNSSSDILLDVLEIGGEVERRPQLHDAVRAPEFAERDGAVARRVVLAKELLGWAHQTVLLWLYEDRPRRPCHRRVGRHAVLHALQHPIGHNLERNIKKLSLSWMDEQFDEAAKLK